MRLVATLLVRDEVDVVAATIEYHLAQGVDLVLVTDNGSVDGTREVLAEYEHEGVVRVRDEPSHDYRQSEWVTSMARDAARLGADWVVNLDADEFWAARDSGATMREVLDGVPPQYGRVVTRRQDLVGRAVGAGAWPRRLVWRDTQTVSSRGTPLGPKVAHRADPDVVVPQGNHDAHGPRVGPPLPLDPLIVRHVPLRTFAQFERKIVNGGSAYESNPDLPVTLGWHWREDYATFHAGGLQAVYRSRSMTPRRLTAGLVRRRIVRDTSLHDGLQSLVGRAVRPDLLRRVLDG